MGAAYLVVRHRVDHDGYAVVIDVRGRVLTSFAARLEISRVSNRRVSDAKTHHPSRSVAA